MPVVEGFEVLTRAYLGQDWAVESTNVDDVILDFVHGQSADEIAASVEGFEDLLASEMSEQEYYDRWIFGLHSGYDPRTDGYTFREFFAHALDLLRATASKATDVD